MKGFRNFAKGLGGAVLGSGDGNLDSAIETLLQRVTDGVLAEDRREALADLRDLLANNAKAKLVVGAQGLPVLIAIVREGHSDIDMLRGTLECLAIVMSHSGSQAEGLGQGPQSAAINAEVFSRGTDNVQLMLGLLAHEPADFYVQYHTVRLLTCLAAVSSLRVQEAILAAPMGVVHLMDMMTDMDALRNEVLLLLIGLTHANAAIQQIAAFEGAFERLLNIIKDEGGADGGIVVQDCLQMMNNLLRGNVKNQMLFREMNHLVSLPGLLRTQANLFKPLARQKLGNLLAGLDSLYLLLAPVSSASAHQGSEQAQQPSDKASRQATLLQAGCLEALTHLIAASTPALRSQALRCTWQLIEGNHTCQQRLLDADIPSSSGTSNSALQVILHIGLHSADIRERIGALKVLQAFCTANTEGQQVLISTITTPSAQAHQTGQAGSFGADLMQCLLNSQPNASQAKGRAARVLSYLLVNNNQGKEAMLAITPQTGQAEISDNTWPMHLLHQAVGVANADGTDGHVHIAVLLMLLMITWLAGASPAVQQGFSSTSCLPLLTDLILNREVQADPLLAGLAAILLGACVTSQTQGTQFTSYLEGINSQIGMASFLSSIESVKQTPDFIAGVNGLQVPTTPTVEQRQDGEQGEEADNEIQDSPPEPAVENPFDQQSTQLILTVEQQVRQRLLGRQAGQSASTSASPGHHASIAQLKQAELRIQQLQREVQQLRNGNSQNQSSATAMHPTSTTQLAAAQEACSRAEEQVSVLQNQLRALQDEKSELQSALTSAKQTEQEASSAAHRFEAELSDLAGAYNNLEVHSFQLEAQVKKLQSQLDHAPSASGTGVAAEVPQQDSSSAQNGEDVDDDDAEEATMTDLLTCLGLEEQKTQILQAKLEELGIDVQPLLDTLDMT